MKHNPTNSFSRGLVICGILKKIDMNIDLKTIGLIILIAIFGVYFTLRNNYVLEIENLNSQIDELRKQNDTLYGRLELVSSTFEEIKTKKPYRVKKNTNVKVITKVVEVEKPISGMEKFEKVMDSINSTLPNRTGQDLINSLKMKTEI